jgi:hypothetical protein
MKKQDTAKISALRDRLLAALAAEETAVKDLASAENDLVKITRRIEDLSAVLDYRDPSIGELPTLRLQKELAEKMIARLSAVDAVTPLLDIVTEGGIQCADLLLEIAENRLNTVCSSLMPFSVSRETALHTARMTDACLGAELAVWRCRDLGNELRRSPMADPRGRCIAAARHILDILDQATSRKGDLLQFLPYASSPDWISSQFASFAMARMRDCTAIGTSVSLPPET